MNILSPNQYSFEIMPLEHHPRIRTTIIPSNSERVQQILDKEYVMGVVEYRSERSALNCSIKEDIPFLSIHMDPFEGDSHVEIWTSDRPVTYGRVGNFNFAVDGENIFSTGSFEEYNEDLDILGEKIYNELFKDIYALHYYYPYRMWNYFPCINRNDKNGLERYRAFCYGRAVSFTNNCNFLETKRFPAATGIGSMSGNISTYFISSLIPNHKHIENPRQVPAYKYPVQYGPKPPSFARATYYKRGHNNFDIYISGTASVIGHKSIHIDDAENQCNTTLDNIEVLISEENLQAYGIEENLSLKDVDCIKVYIRRESDFPIIKKICEQRFSPEASIIYIRADICREDLLVEIEGIVQK